MTISFAGHQFPPEIIRHAVWLYVRFTLSYRDVEDLLAERGLDVSYETVRRWVLQFGPLFARELRRRRPRPTSRWHLDEMAVTIAGRQFWLWRAVDDEGEVLDLLVQRRRDKAAAVKLMRKLLKRRSFAPDVLVTDKLRSYGAAKPEIGLSARHERGLRKTIGPRIPINQLDDESARCSVSKRPDQPNNSCLFTPPSKTHSTSNAISHPAARSASSETKRSGRGEARLTTAERPSDEGEPGDIVKCEPFSVPRPRQGEANRKRRILSKRLRQRARGGQPTPHQIHAEQSDPFESCRYLLCPLTQAHLMCGKPSVQILRVAIEDAGNLREAETEAPQRDDVGRSRHSARIVGTPSGSNAVGGEQTVLLVETQRLGGYAKRGARLRGAEASGRRVHGSPWTGPANFIRPAPGARSRTKVYGNLGCSHRRHQ